MIARSGQAASLLIIAFAAAYGLVMATINVVIFMNEVERQELKLAELETRVMAIEGSRYTPKDAQIAHQKLERELEDRVVERLRLVK